MLQIAVVVRTVQPCQGSVPSSSARSRIYTVPGIDHAVSRLRFVANVPFCCVVVGIQPASDVKCPINLTVQKSPVRHNLGDGSVHVNIEHTVCDVCRSAFSSVGRSPSTSYVTLPPPETGVSCSLWAPHHCNKVFLQSTLTSTCV